MIEDPFAAQMALGADGALQAFNAAGVLAAADVHVALRLARLTGEADPDVLLAAAFAVRAPRLGHVYTDLATVAATASVETDSPLDLAALPWPEPARWSAAVGGSVLRDGPLRLEGTRLYLDRSWQEERRLAADLRALAEEPAPGADAAALAPLLARLVPAGGLPAVAAASAALRRLCVVAGGPGTGKTTTVGLLVALLHELAVARGEPAPLVALAAPTGKAAARLEEALHAQARELPVAPATREALLALSASTLHRLLGWRPDSHSRFRHDRGNRLPHDVLVVDESSMVSLALMGRLVEAVRPGARLVLVGDPGQLVSVEAGAVLGDVVGPARDGLVMRPPARAALERASGAAVTAAAGAAAIGDGVVVLREVHRFGGILAELAPAIECGDADAVLALLRRGDPALRWLPVDVGDPGADLAPVRTAAVAAGRAIRRAAEAGDAAAALAALGTFRLLCAHRRGPYGAARWQQEIEGWLDPTGIDPWYPGRPLLVTQNDYGLGLFNGDTGVVVREAGSVVAAFPRRGGLVRFAPGRLGAVDTVHAMTVHKSQGSQFATSAVLLPGPDSPILTRELLYTAVTRSQTALLLAGTEAVIRRAVERPVARASGLRERLWDGA